MSRSVKSSNRLAPPHRRIARRRATPSVGDALSPDALRRSLCARVFDDPSRITDALHHRVLGRIEAPPHHHADLLQLDVIDGCGGEATIDQRTIKIDGFTLIAVPPGVTHGYALHPARPNAAVWLIKVRVGAATHPTCDDALQVLPHLLTGLTGPDELRQEIAAFVADWTPSGVSVLTVSRLAQAIARWPHAPEASPPPSARETPRPVRALPQDGLSARIRNAAEVLGQRYDDPPDLAELAAAVGVSPRHFARRFLRDFGCTPHAWIAARRLDVARGLLRDADGTIADVADRMGFSSPAAFSRWFSRLASQSPRAFRGDPNNS